MSSSSRWTQPKSTFPVNAEDLVCVASQWPFWSLGWICRRVTLDHHLKISAYIDPSMFETPSTRLKGAGLRNLTMHTEVSVVSSRFSIFSHNKNISHTDSLISYGTWGLKCLQVPRCPIWPDKLGYPGRYIQVVAARSRLTYLVLRQCHKINYVVINWLIARAESQVSGESSWLFGYHSRRVITFFSCYLFTQLVDATAG